MRTNLEVNAGGPVIVFADLRPLTAPPEKFRTMHV